MPKALELVLSDQLYVPKTDLPPSLRNALVRLAAFQNPEFFKAQAMRLQTYDKPRIIACAEDHTEHIALPRGCLDDAQNLLRALKIRTKIRDERFVGRKLEAHFTGELRAAGAAMLAHDFGVLSATTAFGKTVLAAWLIAQRGVNTLVLVHRQQMMAHPWALSRARVASQRTCGRISSKRAATIYRTSVRVTSFMGSYSPRMPAALMVAAHLAISDLMRAANSSALVPRASAPCPSNKSPTALDCAILRNSVLSRFTTSRGAPLGIITPNHVLASYPGKPLSSIVGNEDAAALRCALLMASARSRLEFTNGNTESVLASIRDTCPESRSVTACSVPL